MDYWYTLKTFATQFAEHTGLSIVRTAAFFVVGLIVIKIARALARAATLKSNKLDRAASSFVLSIISVVLYLALAVVLVRSLGFSTAGIIAAFSAVALAVALALKDSLGSLANGVIIIFTKPFKKGDYVEIGGYAGLVRDIRLFNTKILTYDNEAIIIPNSKVLGAELKNYSAMPLRRVVFDFGVPYGSNIEHAKRIVTTAISSIDHVVSTPAPTVALTQYKESALELSARVWTPNENYWDTYFALREVIIDVLRDNGIEVPFNRLEVSFARDGQRPI